ncbi:MAG: hypothetical protein QXP51_04480 [Candidatus Hadarchaeales archaeon]
MLEKVAAWSERERILGAELEGKTLLGQVKLSMEELETLGRAIRAELEKREIDDAYRFLKTNAPLSVATFLVWCGIRFYKAGNFWGGVYRLMGMEKETQVQKSRVARILGEVFKYALEVHKLESFPKLAESGHRYVTPILAHGGIPDYCLRDFFQHFIIPMAQGQYGDDPEDIDAAIRDFQKMYRSSLTDKPVRNFLLHGGNISRDLIRRCRKMALRYMEGQEILDSNKLHLPPAIVSAFYDYVKGMSIEKSAGGLKRWPHPKIFLLPIEQAIMLIIPETEIDIIEYKGVNYKKLFYSVRSGEDEFYVSRVEVCRYMGNKVLLGECMIPIPAPFPSLTVSLCDPESQKEVFQHDLDFMVISTGYGYEENSSLPYLVFCNEDDKGRFHFARDTVGIGICWLVKERDTHIIENVHILEEIDLQGEEWSSFHALRLSVEKMEFLTLTKARAGVKTRIPVCLDFREQTRVRKSGLIPEVTWEGKPVYNRPPIIELPPLQELDRYVLELEDGDGNPIGEYPLVVLAKKREKTLLIDLSDLDQLKEERQGIFRCTISGKLGERMDFDFAYIPELSVDFQRESSYPDNEGHALPMKIVIYCPQAKEIRVEGVIESQPEVSESLIRVCVPPHKTTITARLLFGEEGIVLLIRIPRFTFRLRNGQKRAGSVRSLSGHEENENADVENTPQSLGAERYEFLSDLNTSLKQVRLEDLAHINRVEIFLPGPYKKVKLYLEDHDVASHFSGSSRSMCFELGKFKSFMHNEGSSSFRFRLQVIEQGDTSVDFPFLDVRKGWTVHNLKIKANSGKIHLSWEEDGKRTLEGEVLLKNLYRPWERPSSVRVKVGENSCVIPIPGGDKANGRFAICFRLLDEWEWAEPRLPFELPTDANIIYFPLERQGFTSYEDRVDIYKDLECATQSLFRDLNPNQRIQNSPSFESIKDYSTEDEIRASLLTFLYWQKYFRGHHREVEENLCMAIRKWASINKRQAKLMEMLKKLEDEGGKPISAGVESLRLMLQPESFEPPFSPGERLRKKGTQKIYEYLGIENKIINGYTRPMMKMMELDNQSKVKNTKRRKTRHCLPCFCFFPPDKHVEFERCKDSKV